MKLHKPKAKLLPTMQRRTDTVGHAHIKTLKQGRGKTAKQNHVAQLPSCFLLTLSSTHLQSVPVLAQLHQGIQKT